MVEELVDAIKQLVDGIGLRPWRRLILRAAMRLRSRIRNLFELPRHTPARRGGRLCRHLFSHECRRRSLRTPTLPRGMGGAGGHRPMKAREQKQPPIYSDFL